MMIKVLIVDDEPFIRQGLRILIDWEGNGFTIVNEAKDGKEAIDLLQQEEFDLVITDIKMPNMDGIKLIEQIRRSTFSHLKIIVLSGYYEFEYAKQAIKYNVVDYILKPIQKLELLRTLTEFKESYNKEIENKRSKQYIEQVALERHLSALCSGIYNQDNLHHVRSMLPYCKKLRYISIEMSLNDERFTKLSEAQKRDAIADFYQKLRKYIEPYSRYVLLDMDKRDEVYGVGLIYSKKFEEEKGMNEQEYITKLQEYMKDKQPYKFYLYIGQMVEDIEQISMSFKSAVIAKSFQSYRGNKEIAYYDETSVVRTSTYGIKKESMDELIRHIEENTEDAIEACVDKLYIDFRKYNVDPKIINININYLLCQLLYLAKELEPDIEQEEVLQYISQCAFDGFAVRGSADHFKSFVKEFAGYLAHLRQDNSNGLLKEVEKEIGNNYMKNLSLKSLSEKYYINSAYLGQIFKKKYGVSFKDYLNNYRIDKASEMLIRTNHKVTHIAQAVGYNNLDYFTNRFVQMKGRTPLQYRKQFVQ